MLAEKIKFGTAVAKEIGRKNASQGKIMPGQITLPHYNKKERIMETRENLISTWDKIMMAITFAEEGEHDTARELLTDKRSEQRIESRNRKSEQRPEIRA